MDGDKIKCGENLPLLVKLYLDEHDGDYRDGYEESDFPSIDKLGPFPTGRYRIEPSQPRISRNGICSLTVCIDEISMNFENKKIRIVVSIDSASSQNQRFLNDISPVISHGLVCIRHRLIVRCDMHDNPTPEIWFKDEGGRENRIELHVHLENGDGTKVHNRRVPLKVLLIYGNGEVVSKQDLLWISPESKLVIEQGGSTVIYLRINDVSKNHQKQLFSILVCPETGEYPLLNDISPDTCTPLEVRSKRTKRHRDGSSTHGVSTSASVGANMDHLGMLLHYAG